MKVISLCSIKGGASKTTLSGHLAVEADKRFKVALVDCDPQGSLSGWWDSREAQTPVMAAIGKGGLKATIKSLSDQGYDYLFCDTPPQANADVEAIIKLSDLVICPCIPSPHDLRAIGATVDLIEKNNKPMVFVVSNASATGKLTLQAVTALSAHGTVSPVIMKTRQDYRASMIKGLTVGEVNSKSKSADEMRDLWSYIQSRLKRTK